MLEKEMKSRGAVEDRKSSQSDYGSRLVPMCITQKEILCDVCVVHRAR